jgi:hypothetical protein
MLPSSLARSVPAADAAQACNSPRS